MRFRIDGWAPAATGLGDDVAFTCSASVEAPCAGELVFDGIATLATVLVDGAEVAASESMWVPVRVPVAAGSHTVSVVCEPLTPRLAERRKPRARWRSKVPYDGNLRWFRTTLLGRAPGFAPGPPVVGLWRPAWFVAGEPSVVLRPSLDGADGVVRALADRDGELRCGGVGLALREGEWGELRVPSVESWWPWTHGTPHLYDVSFHPRASDGYRKPVPDGLGLRRPVPEGHGWTRRVGFRTVAAPEGWLADGLRLAVNGVDVFVRGALWTPVSEGEERATLEAARDAGLNAIRLPGTGVYESAAFHDLCDELGLLVWQDLMFANLDYPSDHLPVAAEVDALVDVVGGRPSLAVVCGGSEVEQQAAMLGLDPALARPPKPSRLDELDAVWVPNAPCGAERPLRPDDGVANWFGVGGYRRPLADARAAGVRFASECLALANVGADGVTAGSMRDVDSPWDFLDVSRHYLAELYGPDAPDDLLPWVSGDVLAETFGEWRRAGSPCGGAFVLWLRDLAPGAGWGLLDSDGRPKAALAALPGVLAPVAVWTTDEALGGFAVHVANDRPEPLTAELRVTLYRDGELVVEEATVPVEVPGHGSWTGDVETVLGRWVDAAYAYRFGPPQHDLVVVAIDALGLAHAREPAGRSAARHTEAELGVTIADGVVRSRRALLGARFGDGPQFVLEPGRERRVAPGPLTARNLAVAP